MNKEEFRKRIMGCWLGKNIGGTLGMPMEWNRQKNDVAYYTHDMSNGEPLPNDDLDIQILWLLALEDHGIKLDAKILGEYFNEFMIFTHAEYGTAKTNLRAGLQPPITGTYNNKFKDSCGSYIRADLWACLFPGDPERAAKYAFEDSIVDHGDGEGTYAEIFIVTMEAVAFYEKDIRKLLQIGLSYIPDACAVSKAVRDAIRTFDDGMTPEECRDYIMQHYIGHREWHLVSPEDEEKGYDQGPMGWDVPSNIMIIVYGLLFGKNDYEKSMCIAVNFGEDTDCTAGTIAALFGLMYGYEIFDKKWTDPIGHRIVTISIDPFRMDGRIPRTIEEMTSRVIGVHEQACRELGIRDVVREGDAEDDLERGEVSFFAKPWFGNIYDEMKVVRYSFQYMNVRLNYNGDPVLRAGETKRISFILSNNSKSISSDRVTCYLYTRDGISVLPQNEQTVFLTMAHMGDGIKQLDYNVVAEGPLKPVYHLAAEFVFEENKKNAPMLVPFVLITESGDTLPVKWEKTGSGNVPNMPRV